LWIPRSDYKPQAEEAIEKLKTLKGVLETPSEKFLKIKGTCPTHIFVITFIQEIAGEFLEEHVLDKPYWRSS
jgi:DNA repair protein RadC